MTHLVVIGDEDEDVINIMVMYVVMMMATEVAVNTRDDH